jgi:tetratricopeptide (TPR) repeat protein
LAGLTLIAYFPALNGGFVFDDDSILTNNILIKDPSGLYKFWITSNQVDYWPVTMSSFWIEWRLWGMNPRGYHLANLTLHIIAALILWVILRRLHITGAYWAALLFALHPVNVQSVAWIAEQKNTLSMLFFLASVYCFLRTSWLERANLEDLLRPSPPSFSFSGGRWYWLSFAFFLLAMLSKGSVAILPLVLLGLIAWRRRLRIVDFIQNAPFFGVALAFTIININFQSHGLSAPIRTADVSERLLGAGAIICFYLGKLLLPINLLFFYPLWHIRANEIRWWLPLLTVLGLTGLLLWKARTEATKRRKQEETEVHPKALWRSALFAWGYFCVMLIPVMGFTDIYFMRFSLVADHYQYLAMIGVVVFFTASYCDRVDGSSNGFKFVLAAGLVCLLIAGTWRRTQIYRDAETLYRTTLQRNPECWPADNNLGVIDFESSRPAAAFAHFTEALRLNPNSADAHYNIGRLLMQKPNGSALALLHFAHTIELSPFDGDAHYWLAYNLYDLHRDDEAIEQYEDAIRFNTTYRVAALTNLGIALANAGRMTEALPYLKEAVGLNPSLASAQLGLSYALSKLNRSQGPESSYPKAMFLTPHPERLRDSP